MTGYTEAAELTATYHAEPEEEFREDLPSEFRIVNQIPGGKAKIEHQLGEGQRWVEVAEFTAPNLSFEYAEEMAESLSRDDMRVVFDWTANAWLLEAEVQADE